MDYTLDWQGQSGPEKTVPPPLTFAKCTCSLNMFELDEAIFPQNCWPTAMHVKTIKMYEHVHSEMQVKRPIMSNTRYPRYS